MRAGAGAWRWVRYLIVSVAYAIGYVLSRDVSVSHWYLPAGLRLTCLLLLPRRYWPALVIGELIPVSYHAWNCRDDFGWRWASLAAIPPIAPLALVVGLWRRHARLLRGAHQINMTMLLGLTLAGAVLTATGDAAALAAVQMPAGEAQPDITPQVLFGYFLGDYLGALTLAPSAIAIYLWLSASPPRAFGAAFWQSHLVRDWLLGVLVPLLLLTGLVFNSQGDSMQVFRMAMFLPVVWLTARRGWQGAALGGTLASIAVVLSSTVVRDPAVIQAQAFIAFAITTLLMLGSRIAQHVHSAQASRIDTLRGFQLAQQGLYLEELRLRQVADTLDHLSRTMRENQSRLLDRLRHHLPAGEEHTYSRQVAITQHEMHRLANALYPRGWRERGVPATLRDGPFAQAVHMAGATYRCDLAGRGLSQLAADVHMMLYRLASEVLVYVLARGPVQHIHLQVRGGYTGGRRWVVMRVVGESSPSGHADAAATEESWKQAMTLLGASGLGISSIRDRAQIYGGMVHLRDLPTGLGVTVLLHDSLRAHPLHRGASVQEAPRA
ncbi:MASE1 domain-containing protein [Dyella soli]|uniref:MASE1 domain-containing protein n=1 Tax=Dyella soli TaxID=522319 RepID=A0A4R0YMX5_9GAMM|nr:MASE1 domain-containing protein [Dyella soli]TCI10257.1 hypothetical protein EZM97_15265 [Dyella soli]